MGASIEAAGGGSVIRRAAVAGGELPDTAAAVEARRRAVWESEAVLGAVRRLLARGLWGSGRAR